MGHQEKEIPELLGFCIICNEPVYNTIHVPFSHYGSIESIYNSKFFHIHCSNSEKAWIPAIRKPEKSGRYLIVYSLGSTRKAWVADYDHLEDSWSKQPPKSEIVAWQEIYMPDVFLMPDRFDSLIAILSDSVRIESLPDEPIVKSLKGRIERLLLKELERLNLKISSKEYRICRLESSRRVENETKYDQIIILENKYCNQKSE